jgi:hypothetical protein
LRVFFSNSGDFLLTLVFRTDADTRKPHVGITYVRPTTDIFADVSVYGVP